MTDRARQLRFIREYGDRPYPVDRLVEKVFARNGPDWLTDDQIQDMTERLIKDMREAQRFARASRAAYRKASS